MFSVRKENLVAFEIYSFDTVDSFLNHPIFKNKNLKLFDLVISSKSKPVMKILKKQNKFYIYVFEQHVSIKSNELTKNVKLWDILTRSENTEVYNSKTLSGAKDIVRSFLEIFV